ncbi:ABC-F family ATP-binding cassette domain-containing protein [Lacticaseibacillus thailandensis]|uniref:ABC superfamily ATP binding cassette transporter, ABC protein n=1 Tax=Lacticaseibacillus thailandensis DSM 22698 = JCM 13996 TaxID=1423810 RepID=A0A0R2C7R9_9LACO|nr:ABC-F family ATP-binding cassette domain-containing protein [Lacticaseibacillus thailandensis]KRM87042.1 ABC superfamily ATP binding cassette transporter, ABC protein [Lacticaseibacillus thailandensis DSM 22698 = JCM 13996]
MSILTVTGLSQQFVDKQLYTDANFQVNKEDHLGVVGQNGAGKSTLIKILTGQVTPDAGKIVWQKHLHVGYLDQYANLEPGQTIMAFLQTAFADLYAKADKVNQIYADYATNPDDELLSKAGTLQQELEAADFYNLDTRIETVASGLGLTALGLDHPVDQLSGGQRSKIILAKLLLEEPDMLLLDEPTNYLDKSHIEWLSDWLQEFAGAFIVISHDFDFLEQVTNAILDIEFATITKYTGSLHQAMRQKEANKETYMKAFNKQQAQIQKTEAYIRRFKAGTRSKSAKSREKQLAHMERLTPPGNRAKAKIVFPFIEQNSQVLLDVTDLSVGYDQPLLQPMNFTLSHDEVMALEGFNGVGKSTLLKTVLGKLPALGGTVEMAQNVVVGYFEQELRWDVPKQTPLQFMMAKYPAATQRTLRQVLSRTALTRENVDQPLTLLSGGEQSKVKLADLMMQTTNLLVMDEPTNHLDDDTKAALRQALIEYPGAVILVSHEEGFYDDSWVDRRVNIADLRVK